MLRRAGPHTLSKRASRAAGSTMTTLRFAGLTTLVMLAFPLAAERQVDAVLSGVVVRESTNQPIADATVHFPVLAKTTLTNERGEFRLEGIPAGTHRVEVRHIGDAPANLDVVFRQDENVTRRIVLKKIVTLDSVRVNADASGIQSFDEHRRVGLGKFVTRAELAKRETGRLSDVLQELNGARLVRLSTHAYLMTNRRVPSGDCSKQLENASMMPKGLNCGCYAQVYLDHAPYYRGGDGETVPDINRFTPDQIEAIEFYAGPAQTPLEYSKLNSACGVLVIHTRRYKSA